MQYELEEIPLFDGLKSADLEMIGQHLFSKTYKQNERIIVEGGINRHFCVIKKGKVKICCSGRNGKETVFSFLEAGQYFGEMSLLGRERCCATVYCLQACEIYCIRDMYFRKLLTTVPGLAWRLLNQMSGRLRSSNHCIENLNCRDSVRKVGSVILDLAEYSGYRYKQSVIIKQMPYQHDIAALTGISRETVSRSFSRLEDGNYIRKSGRHLVITDYPRFYSTFSS